MKFFEGRRGKKTQDIDEYSDYEYDWDSDAEGGKESDYDEPEDYGEEAADYDEPEDYGEGEPDYDEPEIYDEDELNYDETEAYGEEADYYESEIYDENELNYDEAEAYGEEADYYESEAYGENVTGYDEPETYVEEESDYDEPEIYEEEAEYYESEVYGNDKEPFFVKIGRAFRSMDVMDRAMIITGAVVLILAIVTGSVFVSAQMVERQVADFADVGRQLDGIAVIGEKGLLAVADAELAKLAAASAVAGEQEEELSKEYEETGYDKQVTVALNFTSIQKDLKIKFINQKTDKLVPNVPFSVTVTTPDGKTYIWSDDDMDGIIYKKDITPGNYQVAMETLTDSKYSDYVVSTESRTTEVKKEIVYKKVDVANEVKQESEVNAQKEDTKKNETVVESSLQDTVTWVESKVIDAIYSEVSRSTIEDPMTIAPNENIGRKNGSSITLASETEPTVTPTAEPTIIPTPEPTSTPMPEPTAIPTAEPTIIPTPEPTVTPIMEPTPSPAPVPFPTVTPMPVSMSMLLEQTTLVVFTGTSVTISASITGEINQEPTVTAESSDSGIAVVSVDKRAITITGVSEGGAVITVAYTENDQTVTATCTVTIMKHPKEDNVTLLKDTSGQQLYVQENGSYREATRADYYTAEQFFIKSGARYTGWQTIEGLVYFFTADGEKVTGEQVIQGARYNFASDGSLVVGNGTTGIDVSKWNGTIDWNAVKNSGVSYVILRCGYRGSSGGTLIEDPKFQSNIKGATAAGLKVGVYFFTQAVDEIEAVEEASMVLELIKNYKISYPVFLDVEASGGRGDKIDKETRTAVCKAFCQTIQNANYTAGIYASKTWLTGRIDASSLSNYKIWLAQYAASPDYSGRYDLWQYRSTGSVSGISGNVDMNISYLGY